MKQVMILLMVLFLLSGCTQNTVEFSPSAEVTLPQETFIETAESTEPQQLLQFSYVLEAVKDHPDAAFITNAVSQILEGDVFRKVTYYGPSEVTIIRNGESMSLDEALVGKLTINQLLYEARLDAENGFCTQSQDSYNGLSHFYFTYPDYGLWICDDVYETPDGKRWKINEVQFFAGSGLQQVENAYGGYIDQVTGKQIDFEDWGLSFTVSDVTREGAALHIQQSGGMQMGQLHLYSCGIAAANDLSGYGIWSVQPDFPIQMNGTSEFRLDFSTLKPDYSRSENYILRLWIFDDQNAFSSESNSMLRDFRDNQWYSLPIPMGFEY